MVEVDSTGNILRSYGSGHGSGAGQLDLPCHVTFDHLGRVIIADYNNSRIVRLDWSTDGGVASRDQVLMTWPSAGSTVKEPRRICFVKTSNVANSSGNLVGGRILASSSKGNIAASAAMSVTRSGSPLQSPSSPSRGMFGSPSRGSLAGGVVGRTPTGAIGRAGEEIEYGRLLVGLGGAVDVYIVCS